MSKITFDFHLHSRHSDGQFSPQELVGRLAQKGIKLVSLTDHDTLDGVADFSRQAKIVGIETVSGVELSAFQDNIGLHILGYGFDPVDKTLKKILYTQRAERKKSFLKVVRQFRKKGFFIHPVQFQALKSLKNVTKPHIFSLIYGQPKNRAILKKIYRFKPGPRIQGSFIEQFMSNPRQIGYVQKKRITGQQAITAIHRAGGWTVLAHPGVEPALRDKKVLFKILEKLKNYGLAGLESFSSAHTKPQMNYFYRLSKQFDLMSTAGTDDHDGSRLGRLKLNASLQKELCQNFLAKLSGRKKLQH